MCLFMEHLLQKGGVSCLMQLVVRNDEVLTRTFLGITSALLAAWRERERETERIELRPRSQQG